jgi:hypothetical protein
MIDTRANLAKLIADLERDIRENPDRRQAELAALRHALSLIDGKPPATVRRETQTGMKTPSKKEYFRSIVNQMMDLEGAGRVHRSEIVKRMANIGMFGGTADLDRDVSKYLSMDGTFAPAGNGYWKRKSSGETDAPNENRPEGSNPSDLLAGDTR